MQQNREQLKALIKEALVEVMEDRNDILQTMVDDSLQKTALIFAIEQGAKTPLIDRKYIANLFGGKL